LAKLYGEEEHTLCVKEASCYNSPQIVNHQQHHRIFIITIIIIIVIIIIITLSLTEQLTFMESGELLEQVGPIISAVMACRKSRIQYGGRHT